MGRVVRLVFCRDGFLILDGCCTGGGGVLGVYICTVGLYGWVGWNIFSLRN